MKLILDKVQKNFNNITAVDKVSIEMESGLYGLLGSNGAGKTTLMRMLCTVLRPSEGRILYQGKDIFKLGEQYRDVLGYLPQEFGYYPDLKVKDYLGYIASLKGLRRSFAKERINELLELVGMQSHSSKKMRELSGGMKRRIGIAQSMLNNPEILILDEPTSGLDPKERIRFRNLADKLANDRIVLLSTHIVSDIEAIAKEVFIMKDGKIINQGSVEKLRSSIPVSSWICRGPKERIEKIANDKGNQAVTIRSNGNYAEARILSPVIPDESALLSTVTLEDVFLYYFGEERGRE